MSLRSPFSNGFTDAAADELAAALKALAEPTRLKILALLRARGPQSGIEIQAALGAANQPTLSHHLSALAAAGLIRSHKQGSFIIRELNAGALRVLAHLLDPGGAA